MQEGLKETAADTRSGYADGDAHDRRLILDCLRLTPEERVLRLEQAHEFRALIREARPYELRER